MKNALIVLKNSINAFEERDFYTANAFQEEGYFFTDTRIVDETDEAFLSATVIDAFESADNLVIASEKRLLFSVRQTVVSALGLDFTQKTALGTGIMERNGKTLFLTAVERGDAGDGYAKSVCVPYLAEKYANRFDKLVFRTVGAGRERMETLFAQAKRMSGEALRYNYRERFGDEVVEIFYDRTAPRMLTEDVLRLFADELSEFLYAMDDTPLEVQIVRLLQLHRRKIAVAESFTGGGVAARLVSVSGASEVYHEGLNTYSEASKAKRLGVPEYVLKTQGAVSDETAYYMALGLLGEADVSVATTGLAGPNSDKSGNPVGLSYIAVGTKENVYVYKYLFQGTREEITQTAINFALFQAYKQIKFA